MYTQRPDLKDLPDPYLPAQKAVITHVDRIAEAKQRRRQALEQFEKKLEERDRADRITLAVCFALMVIVPLIVWLVNS
jgi:hypothetical protein